MRIIIAGSRVFDDYLKLKREVDEFICQNPEADVEIVSGNARGADMLGERYAAEKGYKLKLFKANWKMFGKSAGIIRNEQMADYADTCIVFWDGQSSGTRNMIELSKKKKLNLKIVLIQ